VSAGRRWRSSAYPASCFWVGEYTEPELGRAPEFAVADAILSLSTLRQGSREMRRFQVLKLRGSGFRSGQHTYRIGPDGMRFFPRLGAVADVPVYAAEQQRLSSGIAALDATLDDGYWGGASTLVAGPSGAGKTLMGLHFIFRGAETGEPGIIATLQENPVQLERMVRGFGWTLAHAQVELMYRSPIEEWYYDLLEAIERTGARRVMIDSLADLRLATIDEVREYLYTLLHCATQGISLMLTLETTPNGTPERLRLRHLQPLRQRRRPPTRAPSLAARAHRHRAQDPRRPPRSGRASVHDHRCRHPARRRPRARRSGRSSGAAIVHLRLPVSGGADPGGTTWSRTGARESENEPP
jgi:KaiC/GvpD/RAD55 family RecA-like ATPase